MNGATCCALPASLKMMFAQFSGEITLYTAFSSISTTLPTPSASAPPLPPSPIHTAITGTGSRAISRRVARNGFGLPALFRVHARDKRPEYRSA